MEKARRGQALPRPVGSIWLFCTRKGQPYIKWDGQTSGFDSIWQRRITKASCHLTLITGRWPRPQSSSSGSGRSFNSA
jgi:hypothetical protein